MISVRPAYAEPAPISRALKGLVKLHGLPPYQALYGADRAAVVVIAARDAAAWRQALGFAGADEGFWLGTKVQLKQN